MPRVFAQLPARKRVRGSDGARSRTAAVTRAVFIVGFGVSDVRRLAATALHLLFRLLGR